ncbi:MAG TPA: hypothetical protein PKC30_13940 [Saprospiraceae bacterium]|nr:hypothetical protein [Saprospiraceae bacterium]
MNKPRVIKDYEKLDINIQEQIKLQYPYGFEKHLITFKNLEGKFISALPFETEDRYFLVRMTQQRAKDIIKEDDDYDEDGILKDEVKEVYEDKFSDLDSLVDAEDSDEEDMD